jgi:hypothetical protein
MGLDWGQVSLSGYTEAIEARNDTFEDDTVPEPSDWLKRLVNGEAAGHGPG